MITIYGLYPDLNESEACEVINSVMESIEENFDPPGYDKNNLIAEIISNNLLLKLYQKYNYDSKYDFVLKNAKLTNDIDDIESASVLLETIPDIPNNTVTFSMEIKDFPEYNAEKIKNAISGNLMRNINVFLDIDIKYDDAMKLSHRFIIVSIKLVVDSKTYTTALICYFRKFLENVIENNKILFSSITHLELYPPLEFNFNYFKPSGLEADANKIIKKNALLNNLHEFIQRYSELKYFDVCFDIRDGYALNPKNSVLYITIKPKDTTKGNQSK